MQPSSSLDPERDRQALLQFARHQPPQLLRPCNNVTGVPNQAGPSVVRRCRSIPPPAGTARRPSPSLPSSSLVLTSHLSAQERQRPQPQPQAPLPLVPPPGAPSPSACLRLDLARNGTPATSRVRIRPPIPCARAPLN
ncbi:hypothetical protein VPH35_122320 [Triticum aestivum]